MTTSHHPCFTNERFSFRGEDELSVESCEDLDEEGLISGKLTFWIGREEEFEFDEMNMDETQDDETMLEASKLEEPLQLNTTCTGVILGEDVDDYLKISMKSYESDGNQTQSSEEETHDFETPSREGSWTSDWSRYDPYTFWTGTWILWVEDGIRIILGYE